jgi:hypothetical protein
MNPIIARDLMQARIADLHRPPGRISTGSRKHTAIWRICWTAIAVVAGAMVFLAGAPAALAVHVPPPGETGNQVAPPVVVNPAAAGTPGWQIVLIAVGSALVASALTLLAVRATRRATPAQPSQS